MCLYIYAPSQHLSINYVSELITLKATGHSSNLIDLLIENQSEDPISTLYVIYPNRFFTVKVSDDGTQFNYQPVGSFTDTSNELKKGTQSENNWLYSSPGYSLRTEVPPDCTFKVPDWAHYFSITRPNPTDPTQTIILEGIIAPNESIQPRENLEPAMWLILEELNFTLLQIDLKFPLHRNSPRWLQLKFRGAETASNLDISASFRTKLQRGANRLSNALHYDYQIFGPSDVRDRLYMYLVTYKNREKTQDLNEACCRLLHILSQEDRLYDAQTTVDFRRWFINIFPGKLRRITDALIEGDLSIAGNLPNFVAYKGTNRKIYEWKAVNSVQSANGNHSVGSFKLTFQAKPTSYLYQYLPWISLALSLAAIVLSYVFFLASI